MPGRCEPGTGEINYPAAAAIHTAGYTGVIGLEAWAAADSHAALRSFRGAFTGPS